MLEDSIHDQALTWLKATLEENASENPSVLLKMVDSPHEGQTYCIQWRLKDANSLAELRDQFAPFLHTEIQIQFPQKAFIFDSTMQYL